MAGARFLGVEVRRPDLRTAFPRRFAARLKGQTVERLDRRAKYLLAVLSSGETLLMHLGMSGSFRIDRGKRAATAPPDRHDHVILTLSNGATITFNDPRRFGVMDMIGIVGYYDLVSMALNVQRSTGKPGNEAPLVPLTR